MSFDQQVLLQGGRCWICQRLIPAALWTRDHIYPHTAEGLRGVMGDARHDCLMACERCNRARGALCIGSNNFTRWIKRVVMHGKIYPFVVRRSSIAARLEL